MSDLELLNKNLKKTTTKNDFYKTIEKHSREAYAKASQKFIYSSERLKELYNKFHNNLEKQQAAHEYKKSLLLADSYLTDEEHVFLTEAAYILNKKYEKNLTQNNETTFSKEELFLIDNFRNQPAIDDDTPVIQPLLVNKNKKQQEEILSISKIKDYAQKGKIPHDEYSVIIDVKKLEYSKIILEKFEKDYEKLSQIIPSDIAKIKANEKLTPEETKVITETAEKLNKQFEMKLFFTEEKQLNEDTLGFEGFDEKEVKLIKLFREQPFIDYRVQYNLIFFIRKNKKQHKEIVFDFQSQKEKQKKQDDFEYAQKIHDKFMSQLKNNFTIEDLKTADNSISEDEKKFITDFAYQLSLNINEKINTSSKKKEILKSLTNFEQNLFNIFQSQPISTPQNIQEGKVFLLRKQKHHAINKKPKKQKQDNRSFEEKLSAAKQLCHKFEESFYILSQYIKKDIAMNKTKVKFNQEDKELITEVANSLNIKFENICKEIIINAKNNSLPIPTNIDIEAKAIKSFDKYEQAMILCYRQQPPKEMTDSMTMSLLIAKSTEQHLKIKSIEKIKAENV